MRFFTLRVASNKEDRVREALQRKVRIEGLAAHVGGIVRPGERGRTTDGGKGRARGRPGGGGPAGGASSCPASGCAPRRKARSATATASCTRATSSSSWNW